jgi:hypothetical protein
MLALTLLTIGGTSPTREPVQVTHDLASLTDGQAMRLQGRRHRTRVVRDSDPEHVNDCVCFDCQGPEEGHREDGHRTVYFRKGDSANGQMTEGVVEARVRIVAVGGWGPFSSFWHVRLVEAVEVE